MLTEKQYNLLMFINKVNRETGKCPSFDEMKDAIGLKSKSGIHALITSLEERNFIRRLPHKARAMEVIRLPRFKPQAVVDEEKKREEALKSSSVQIPLYGKIAAGTPIEAIANETEMVSVPFDMVSIGQFYALTIEGDSMIEAGIMDGDTAIIRRQNQADNGKIVVALVDNSEATLKILKKDGDVVHLIPCNKQYRTRTFSANRIKIQGVLSGIIRNYRN
ncbi:MAG: transcriptional repressor LexA [Alphaproteobacteria bacterium]|nr:transcriptional repressor LexA [Alphaproteobacteria bacterium]